MPAKPKLPFPLPADFARWPAPHQLVAQFFVTKGKPTQKAVNEELVPAFIGALYVPNGFVPEYAHYGRNRVWFLHRAPAPATLQFDPKNRLTYTPAYSNHPYEMRLEFGLKYSALDLDVPTEMVNVAGEVLRGLVAQPLWKNIWRNRYYFDVKAMLEPGSVNILNQLRFDLAPSSCQDWFNQLGNWFRGAVKAKVEKTRAKVKLNANEKRLVTGLQLHQTRIGHTGMARNDDLSGAMLWSAFGKRASLDYILKGTIWTEYTLGGVAREQHPSRVYLFEGNEWIDLENNSAADRMRASSMLRTFNPWYDGERCTKLALQAVTDYGLLLAWDQLSHPREVYRTDSERQALFQKLANNSNGKIAHNLRRFVCQGIAGHFYQSKSSTGASSGRHMGKPMGALDGDIAKLALEVAALSGIQNPDLTRYAKGPAKIYPMTYYFQQL